MNTSIEAATEPLEVPAADNTSIMPGDHGALPIQELIITLIGEYVGTEQQVWSGGLVRLLRDLGFKSDAARVALGRVVSRGLIERVKDGRRVYYQATQRLAEVLIEGHRQSFWFRYERPVWRGTWTLVWYTIPEERLTERRRLSRFLSFLGFANLQDGIWISPRDRAPDIERITRRLDVTEHVSVLVGQVPAWVESDRVLERVHDLAFLGSQYDNFVARFCSLSSGDPSAHMTPLESFIIRTHVLEFFRRAAPLDPKVAVSGGRFDGQRDRAIDCFERLEVALRNSAENYALSHLDLRPAPSGPSVK